MTATLIKNTTLVTPSELKENCGIYIEDEKIVSVFSMQQVPDVSADIVIDARQSYALPGLIDLHIHGFAGHGPELGTAEELLEMSTSLAAYGVTSFCPTLYCAQVAQMKHLLTRLSPALGQETGARILGFHLEGPFISPQKPGVMKPQDISPADVHALEELYTAANGKIACMTLAPELDNIAPVVDFCLQHHILPQAGHTNATYEEFISGVRCGITHATHAFNAMSPFARGERDQLWQHESGKSSPQEILDTIAAINAEGRPIWKPMHMQPIYRTHSFITAEGNGRGRTNAYIEGSGADVGADIFRRGLCLPSDNKMTEAQQDVIIEIIHRCFM